MYEPTAQTDRWPAPSAEQDGRPGRAIGATALLVALVVIGGALYWATIREESFSTAGGTRAERAEAFTESFTTVPAGIATMSCEQLGAAHGEVADRLASYVASVYRGSWDASSAQRRLAAEGTRDEALDVLRALNRASETCSYGAGG